MSAASRAIWLSRGDLLKPEEKSAIDLVAPIGTPSSAAGLQAWKSWYGPLFLDTKYTHRRKRFNDAWLLPPEYVETIDRNPVVLPDREQVITERQVATVSVAKVLKKSLVTELTLDPYGKPVHKKSPPSGVDAQTFDEMDIVSASLTKMDDALFADGERERGGFVHMNQVRVFDTFGTPMNWSSNERRAQSVAAVGGGAAGAPQLLGTPQFPAAVCRGCRGGCDAADAPRLRNPAA